MKTLLSKIFAIFKSKSKIGKFKEGQMYRLTADILYLSEDDIEITDIVIWHKLDINE